MTKRESKETASKKESEEKRGGGRPSKFSLDIQKRIAEALAAGNTREASARYGGIHPATFFDWMNKGEAGEEPFVEFSEAIKKAESDAEVAAVAAIKRAGQGYTAPRTTIKTKTYLEPRKQKDGSVIYAEVTETETTQVEAREFSWQAAAWWLERRKPKDWKEVKQLDVRNLPDDKILELLESDTRDDDAEAESQIQEEASPQTRDA